MADKKQVQRLEMKAHQGEYGAWRKGFCKSYRDTLNSIRRQATEEVRYFLDSNGARISCHRGCSYCCTQYISISSAHGLLIVDYLYSNPKLMDSFLSRYEKWERSVKEQTVLQELEKYTTLSYRVRRTPQELLTAYAEFEISCPFLAAGDCMIYPVRPICCASHLSLSPPDWCRAKSADPAMIYEATPSQEDLRRLAMLGEPMLSFHQETMPRLIFRLLTEGLPEMLRQLQIMAGGMA